MIAIDMHALVEECVRMRDSAQYEDDQGFSYWPDADEPNDCGTCTTGALLLARKFNGYVAGYHIEDSEPSRLIAHGHGGHDFAVIGGFIVDWWAWQYEESLTLPVVPIDSEIAALRYKPSGQWEVHPENDFRE